ncbi:MAG: Cupin 2 conserved barrel domain protein, partial [Anaerocolumna sp.]|nr:Cupin 2 conserved barrel domain protein [Anaerocolumna sp.]
MKSKHAYSFSYDFLEKILVIICPNWGILKFKHKLKEDYSMNKYNFNDYFHEPEGKIAKRMIFKSDNVIAFVLNIAKGEILPGHTHLE